MWKSFQQVIGYIIIYTYRYYIGSIYYWWRNVEFYLFEQHKRILAFMFSSCLSCATKYFLARSVEAPREGTGNQAHTEASFIFVWDCVLSVWWRVRRSGQELALWTRLNSLYVGSRLYGSFIHLWQISVSWIFIYFAMNRSCITDGIIQCALFILSACLQRISLGKIAFWENDILFLQRIVIL